MDKVLKTVTIAQKRVLLQYRKISLGSAAMRIAAGRNPAANLLDMVVFVTLQHMVVAEYRVPQVYAQEAQGLLEVHSRLEKEIWSLAGELLTPAQLENLRHLIKEWHAAHPEQRYISDVRLKGLTQLRGKSPIETEQEVNSLLGQVQKSLGKIDEALIMAERAMFYFERMPRMLALQTELLTDQITANPDIRQLVGDINKIAGTFEDLTQTIQGLRAERRAAIGQVTGWTRNTGD